MDKKKKIIMGILLVLVFIITVVFFVFEKNQDENKLIIKDNVRTITSETEYQPISVGEETIIFENDPKYKRGDVIVSGIIKTAPDGFIRKVVDIKEENGKYVYLTEHATLLDVFEEAHIIRCFVLSEDGVREAEDTMTNSTIMNMSNTIYSDDMLYDVQTAGYATDISVKPMLLGSIEKELFDFSAEFEEELSETVTTSGNIGFSTWIEIKIDIKHGEIDFGIVTHIITEGGLNLICTDDSENKFLEKTIFEKDLPSISFLAGEVPIVITNDFAVELDGTVKVEGTIETVAEVGTEQIIGFEYSSRTGEIKEIKEIEYLADGMTWDTKGSASGSTSVEVSAHVTTLLYGATGADIAVGVEPAISGEVSLGIDLQGDVTAYGRLGLSISPTVQGAVVVEIPIINERLADCELFDVELKPIWERTWEYLDERNVFKEDIKQKEYDDAVHNGDISKEVEKAYIYEIDTNRPYKAIFTSEFVDRGAYYSVKGILGTLPYIPVDVAEGMREGDEYKLFDNEYTYKGKVPFDKVWGMGSHTINGIEVKEFHLFEDKYKYHYYTHAQPELADCMIDSENPEYFIYPVPIENKKTIFLDSSIVLLYEDYEFRIRKNEMVSIFNEPPKPDGSNSSNSFTLEECITQKISNYKGSNIANTEGVMVDINFDRSGFVVGLVMCDELTSVERNKTLIVDDNCDIFGDKILKKGSDVDGWSVIESQATSGSFEFVIDECYQTETGVYVISEGWLCLMFDASGNGTPGQYALWSIGDCGSPVLALEGEYAPVEGIHFWKIK